MAKQTARSKLIEEFVLMRVDNHGDELSGLIANEFRITVQAANRHLLRMAHIGLIERSGRTKDTRYRPVSLYTRGWTYALASGLEEDVVYRDKIEPLVQEAQANVRSICAYGVTEMINNAIDHSGGKRLTIHMEATTSSYTFRVADDGIGIFRKISKALNLQNESEAILELAKGKFTTDPTNHSGQGIFFTSRAVDEFSILSHDLTFMAGEIGDWLMQQKGEDDVNGTSVWLQIRRLSKRSLEDVFSQYSTNQDLMTFDRTYVPVRLADDGEENLVSRSQAKRLLARVERFKEVILDFARVSHIGQAFADQIFRVFTTAHPDTHITYTNATPDVEQMILRAKTSSPEQQELDLTTSASESL